MIVAAISALRLGRPDSLGDTHILHVDFQHDPTGTSPSTRSIPKSVRVISDEEEVKRLPDVESDSSYAYRKGTVLNSRRLCGLGYTTTIPETSNMLGFVAVYHILVPGDNFVHIGESLPSLDTTRRRPSSRPGLPAVHHQFSKDQMTYWEPMERRKLNPN